LLSKFTLINACFWFEPRKKINGFECPLIDNVFLGIFLVYFGLFWENSVCFGCFDTGPKHRNKPIQTEKKFSGFVKQTEKQPKQIEFRFVSVRTEKKIWLFRGHPSENQVRSQALHNRNIVNSRDMTQVYKETEFSLHHPVKSVQKIATLQTIKIQRKTWKNSGPLPLNDFQPVSSK
jgi:hypothetical protein